MSAGRSHEGAGCITWWGFSPACDLLRMGPERHEDEVNILLVGSGEPRHILKTIAGLKSSKSIHVWVVESCMELVARQLLLLYLALMPLETMGNNEKTEVFLEVFGNAEIRSLTEETLKFAASQLLLSVTEALETPTHSCLNTTLLKFKERDELVRIFKTWTEPQASPVLMSKAWDYRVRQHLGTRYDCKSGCFDWDLAMKLHDKGCGVISKHQYTRWRAQGLAFEMREGLYQVTNPTLLSSRVFNQKGNKESFRGYWGDIVSSPYLAYGVETDDKRLLKKQNNQHIKTAQDISFANILTLFQALASRQACCTGSQSDTAAAAPSPQTERKSVTVHDLMHLNGISVAFLPLDSLSKLPDKQKYSNFFHTIYFSASCAHQLSPMLGQIAAPHAALVMELAKYVLDLNKEQEADFARKATRIALDTEFEPWQEERKDGVHAVFIAKTR